MMWMVSHWFMLLLASVLSFIISLLRRKNYGFSICKALLLTGIAAGAGCAGTKLLFWIENIGKPFSLLGGVSFYGAVFFVPLVFFVVSGLKADRFKVQMDFIAPYIPLTAAFMRVACYFNGCCGSNYYIMGGQVVHPPVQLIECGWDLLLFGIMLILERRKWIRTGLLYPIFGVGYSVVRFGLEFIRDTPKNIAGLSIGQWLSIPAFLLSSLSFAYIIHVGGKKK